MDRVESLLARLTVDEKIAMVSGSGPWHSTGVPRLDIPRFKMTDGPNAARGDGSGARALCLPVGSALGASWNRELLEQVGTTLGEEAHTKGAQVLLGPTINLQRTPIGGRNFECYSEDPLLTKELAVAFIRGVQSQRVAACPKHFVCNDVEQERHTISARVDEQTLREIYLRPFEGAVTDAGAWCVMSAYNRINGVYASSHRELLIDVLKGEWGFDGVVISDWGASLETVENTNGGLDLEMPGPARTMGARLRQAIDAGRVEQATLDDKVRRLLRLLVRTGRLDADGEVDERTVDTPEKRALARRAATEGMVLLRNETLPSGRPLLPLDPNALARVAVIGPDAECGRIQGGGSSAAHAHREVHPLAALRARLPDSVAMSHAVGCLIHKYLPAFATDQLRPTRGSGRGFALDYFDNPDLAGDPVREQVVSASKLTWFGAFATDFRSGPFSARVSADFTPSTSGSHTFGLMSAGRSRMRLDGELLIDNWTEQTRGESFYAAGSTEVRAVAELRAGHPVRVEFEYQRPAELRIAGMQVGVLPPQPDDPIAEAVEAARGADAVVLVAGTNSDWETEGNDRTTIALPGDQRRLIERVCGVNPRTVVVLNAGSVVDTTWLEHCAAALQVWFPGQEFGEALCDVLLGAANPSGKLPLTFPARLEDSPAFETHPGRDGELVYGERRLLGYRGYAARAIEPSLPFGHGLSYTRFEYGPLRVQRGPGGVVCTVEVANVGERGGAEVVQLYLDSGDPEVGSCLAGFEKIYLSPGQRADVEVRVEPRALQAWDVDRRSWLPRPGPLELAVGSSSRDLRARARLASQPHLP